MLTTIPHRLEFLSPFHPGKPLYPILGILLPPWPQLRLMQTEVVYRADAQDAHSREAFADPIHQRPAVRAEMVRHLVPTADGLRLREGLELVLPTQVLEVLVGDDEVGGEHGGGDLVAVGAVADEAVDEAGRGGGLGSRGE